MYPARHQHECEMNAYEQKHGCIMYVMPPSAKFGQHHRPMMEQKTQIKNSKVQVTLTTASNSYEQQGTIQI